MPYYVCSEYKAAEQGLDDDIHQVLYAVTVGDVVQTLGNIRADWPDDWEEVESSPPPPPWEEMTEDQRQSFVRAAEKHFDDTPGMDGFQWALEDTWEEMHKNQEKEA